MHLLSRNRSSASGLTFIELVVIIAAVGVIIPMLLVGIHERFEAANAWIIGDPHLKIRGQPESRHLFKLRPTDVAGWPEGIHFDSGNIGLPDGSVRVLNNFTLPKWLSSLVKTNWIVRP